MGKINFGDFKKTKLAIPETSIRNKIPTEKMDRSNAIKSKTPKPEKVLYESRLDALETELKHLISRLDALECKSPGMVPDKIRSELIVIFHETYSRYVKWQYGNYAAKIESLAAYFQITLPDKNLVKKTAKIQ